VYQLGQSEEWVGEWMQKTGRRNEMVIATKYSGGYMAGQPVQQSNFGGTGTKSLHIAVESSLKKLQTDYIDLV
jgi:aryl-alcohol dehydrogenase-like predicted oxidoreductase